MELLDYDWFTGKKLGFRQKVIYSNDKWDIISDRRKAISDWKKVIYSQNVICELYDPCTTNVY